MLNRNKMLPKENVAKAKEVIAKIKEYAETHAHVTPNIEGASDPLQRIHTVLYLDMVNDIVKTALALESLLNSTEDEFIDKITNGRKMTIEEVDRRVIVNMVLDLLNS